MHSQLLRTITNLGSPRVLLAGDFMLDVAVYGDVKRISPHAPIPIFHVRNREYNCGGAGFVAADVAAMGGIASCIGIIGIDHSASKIKSMLDAEGADISGLIETDTRPTITKTRLIGLAQQKNKQELMRVDEETADPIGGALEEAVIEKFTSELAGADVVCLQDYNKGLLSTNACKKMIRMATDAGKKVLIDPWPRDDYSKYAGATLITPNRTEASMASGIDINSIEAAQAAAEKLFDELKLEAVVITLDKDGAFLKTADICRHIPTVPRSVYDVSGAGDMILASLAMTLAAGCDFETSVQTANLAAGIQVGKFGAASVSIDEIVNEIVAQNRGKSGKIQPLDSLLTELNWHRSQNETIVFTNGCFDVLHRGHIEYLSFCKSQGDIVVLGLNSDDSVRRLKGPERPVNNQHDRAAVLAALEAVDYITIFEEDTPQKLIEAVRPDMLVKGSDWKDKGVVGQEFVESCGGKVIYADFVEGKSSTSTINKLKTLGQ